MNPTEEIVSLLKARCTLLVVQTPEEGRAERMLVEAAQAARYGLFFWDCNAGLLGADGEELDASLADPRAMLRAIGASSDRAVYVLRDLHRWLDPLVVRGLRSLARKLQTEAPARSVVLLSPPFELPQELAEHAVVVPLPLPDRTEMGAILDSVVEALPEELRVANVNGERERAIDSALGLSGERAGNAYAKSLVTRKRVDPALVSSEKKRVVSGVAGITWYDPDPRGLAAVGGYDGAKQWLELRRLAFSEAARAYGLPAPRGILLVGPPGCGKSLFCKATATTLGVPLLRADPGGAKSKYVGESEGNARKVWAIARTVAPCALWYDEIEKAFGGSTGPQGDGGVQADALGTFLFEMQEGAPGVFVIATANDVSQLPPEMLRKGRFDEVFAIDLPTRSERAAILAVSLQERGREPFPASEELDALLDRMEGWSGAEIAATVPAALFASFADGARELRVSDLVAAAATTVPLSESMRESIDRTRAWCKGRARPASLPDAERSPKRRALDLA